jgi:competence protein ComGC
MKECPVCKTTYTDDSLRFCLADGASLLSVNNEQETVQIFPDQNPLRIEIQKDTSSLSFPPSASQNQPKKRSVIPFVIAGFVSLLLLGIVGIAALLILNPFSKAETVTISNNPKPTETPVLATQNKNNELKNNELKEKLANLEKQIQDQKNQKTSPNTQPFPTSTQNKPAAPTARVAPSNDGFLSLRTEPSVKTGTQLVKIPSGATVNLENCEKNYTTIDNRRGRWCMVSYAGEIGWAFDAWLIY